MRQKRQRQTASGAVTTQQDVAGQDAFRANCLPYRDGVLESGGKRGFGGQPIVGQDSPDAAGMRKVIASLTLSDSGRFLQFQGKELPW